MPPYRTIRYKEKKNCRFYNNGGVLSSICQTSTTKYVSKNRYYNFVFPITTADGGKNYRDNSSRTIRSTERVRSSFFSSPDELSGLLDDNRSFRFDKCSSRTGPRTRVISPKMYRRKTLRRWRYHRYTGGIIKKKRGTHGDALIRGTRNIPHRNYEYLIGRSGFSTRKATMREHFGVSVISCRRVFVILFAGFRLFL